MKEPIKCDCGKTLAFIEDGKILIKCKKCKREIDLIEHSKKKEEPRA